MKYIDINCDMGESFGAYSLGDDLALMDYVSSVNIACGYHAGDPSVMRRTVDAASNKKLAIGAHPGFPDLQGFGRRNMMLSAEEVYDIVLYQVGALEAFTKAAGTRLHHVKPHGALYNAAAKDKSLADAIARAVFDFDKSLVFVGLSGSELIRAGNVLGLRTASEVFADRTYQDDGSLTPRTMPKALIDNSRDAADQALSMATNGKVTTQGGKIIAVRADSICIHGDGPHALAHAREIFQTLSQHGITVGRP